MTIIIAIILFLIFLFLSGLHIYWAFGGKWGNEAVIPTKIDNAKLIMPGIVPTLIIGLGLLGIGLFILGVSKIIECNIPTWLDKYGLWMIAGIFILRAIGDFNYVGFFKKIKHTKFGLNDSKYYSPLCLIIGILTISLELSR